MSITGSRLAFLCLCEQRPQSSAGYGLELAYGSASTGMSRLCIPIPLSTDVDRPLESHGRDLPIREIY